MQPLSSSILWLLTCVCLLLCTEFRFAAALETRVPAWVMNVVPTTSSDTLPVVYNRGLLGVYHDWCESFNTYPRTYDLLHSDHMLSGIISADR